MPNWLRWVLIIPAAGIAYFLVQIVGGIASETWPFSDRGQDLFSQALNSALGPWALVRAGAATAPHHYRFITAQVLAAVAALITVMLVGATLLGNLKTGYKPGWIALTSLISLIALGFAIDQVKKDQKKSVEA